MNAREALLAYGFVEGPPGTFRFYDDRARLRSHMWVETPEGWLRYELDDRERTKHSATNVIEGTHPHQEIHSLQVSCTGQRMPEWDDGPLKGQMRCDYVQERPTMPSCPKHPHAYHVVTGTNWTYPDAELARIYEAALQPAVEPVAPVKRWWSR